MCKRIIVENLQIGGLNRDELLENAQNMYPEVAKYFIKKIKDNPPVETVRLVGIRCCQYKLGIASSRVFFKEALEDGYELCPLYLPFHYVKEHGSEDETFIFASRRNVIKKFRTTGGGTAEHFGFLAVNGPGIFDYAQDQPYGGAVEFAFIQRL